MEWSNDASLRLIDEYKQHPVLWDARHQSYFSKNRKHEAWEAIGAAMGLKTREVKQKMNSLLGSFRREKSRIRMRNRDGFNGERYYSKWFAFEKMQFLLCNDETSDETNMIKCEEEEESVFEELKYPPIQEYLEIGQSEKAPPGVSSMSVPPPKRTKYSRKLPPDPLFDDISIFQPQDEYTAFGQYIACKLRKFDPRSRAFIEHAINNVFFEADMGKYDNLPSPFDISRQNLNASTSHTNQMPENLVSDSSTLDNLANSS